MDVGTMIVANLMALWRQPQAWFGWLTMGWGLAALLQAGAVVMAKRSPVSTLAWIMVLTLLPGAGLLFYIGFGPQRLKRQRLKRLLGRARLPSRDEVQALVDEHEATPERRVQHARLIERTCGLPVSTAQRVEVLQDGVRTFASIIEAVKAAREHVHLEYYIFEPDRVGAELRDTLLDKLREQVPVRLLVDAVGSGRLNSWRQRRFLAEFRQLGGEFAVFHPARFDRRRPLVNLRTHRKIVVCDGRVGFTGGINITEDEHEGLRPDAYRDTHVRIEGAAVRWLQYVFLQDWVYARGQQEGERLAGTLVVDEAPGPIALQLVSSGPDDEGEAIHRSMIDAIYAATERVWLTTPYFVPTEPALYALTDAARRGVDVRLLVPRKSDSRLVTWAARSYYGELLRSGVKVYEYLPRMLHAKTLVIDDDYAQVGTANYDHRSFRLNFEVAVVLYEPEVAAEVAKGFEADLAQARQLKLAGRRPFGPRFIEAVARLFSPLL